MSFERRKVRVGRVVSDVMDKTVVVLVEWRRTHPLYRKSMRRVTRFKAHDAENSCRIGDTIKIMETRPLSKTKRWRVVEIIAREEIAEIQPDEITVDESVAAAAGGREAPEAAVELEEVPESAEQEQEAPVATAEPEEVPDKPKTTRKRRPSRRATTEAAAEAEQAPAASAE